MSFSEEIKRIRQASFLSQEALAKELDVSFATVNRLETGKTTPSYKTLKALNDFCKARNIEFDAEKYM